MLTEKYRPKALSEIVGQIRIVEAMRSIVAKREMANCLFVGKPGTGKTAMAHALKNELGLTTQDLFLELNASDDRKLETLRDRIKGFAKTAAHSDIPFKIILMDEMDGYPKLSQQTLRRIMEQHSGVRFILTANAIGTLSQAIVSRCAIYQFRALTTSQMSTLLNRVLTKEQKTMPTDVIAQICVLSEGDARLAINSLEAMLSLDTPTPQDVTQFIGRSDEESVYSLLGSAKNGDALNTFAKMKTMLDSGVTGDQVMRQIFYSMLSPRVFGYTEQQRARILIHLGSIMGADDNIRLAAFLAKVIVDEKLRV